MRLAWIALGLAAVALGGCATGDPDNSFPAGDNFPDASTRIIDARVRPDAEGLDGAVVSDLDPQLDVVGPGGEVCGIPGETFECGAGQVCRFYDSQLGRCGGCGLCATDNDPCAASSECGLEFMCYQGRCTKFCTLFNTECGSPLDCLDIGHPTRGVCRPAD